MKKSFFIAISLIAVFFLAGATKVNAQWAIEVGWDDGNCDCNNITLKTLEWVIYKGDGSTIFHSRTLDVTNSSSPQTFTGSETIIPDQQFIVCARVTYYDEGSLPPQCCTGHKCDDTADSGNISDLQNPFPIVVIMN